MQAARALLSLLRQPSNSLARRADDAEVGSNGASARAIGALREKTTSLGRALEHVPALFSEADAPESGQAFERLQERIREMDRHSAGSIQWGSSYFSNAHEAAYRGSSLLYAAWNEVAKGRAELGHVTLFRSRFPGMDLVDLNYLASQISRESAAAKKATSDTTPPGPSDSEIHDLCNVVCRHFRDYE